MVSLIQLPVRYLSQRDNRNPYTGKLDPHNQCMVSSFVMLMNWIGDKSYHNFFINYSEELHLTLVGLNPKELEKRRYNSFYHARICNTLLQETKVKLRFQTKDLNYSELQSLFQEVSSPVIVASLITTAGHILVYLGDSWHDPYGKCSEETGQYSGKGFKSSGESIVYSEKFITKKIFKNQRRRCWFLKE
ncbi:MAG: hypothetical protein SFU98_11005 [Leptospiraceae bacterium]|nr:hypothetical protein [Leptospiraceae bacterium]